MITSEAAIAYIYTFLASQIETTMDITFNIQLGSIIKTEVEKFNLPLYPHATVLRNILHALTPKKLETPSVFQEDFLTYVAPGSCALLVATLLW